MRRFFSIIVLFTISHIAFATTHQDAGNTHKVTTNNTKTKAITATLRLDTIKAMQISEQRGDELYMNVTVYHSGEKPQNYQIPNQPLHWQSQSLDKVNALKLWQGTLKNGQVATLVLSLIEQDVPPWNTDDFMGSTRLKLRNDEGKLHILWGKPGDGQRRTSKGKLNEVKTFDFANRKEKSHYQVAFSLQTAD